MTPAVENQVLNMVEAHAEDAFAPFDFAALGRLAEPKLRRARDLAGDDATRAHCDVLIQQAIELP